MQVFTACISELLWFGSHVCLNCTLQVKAKEKVLGFCDKCCVVVILWCGSFRNCNAYVLAQWSV